MRWTVSRAFEGLRAFSRSGISGHQTLNVVVGPGQRQNADVEPAPQEHGTGAGRLMTPEELIAEAGRLAIESVANQWGGPFGAVIARGAEVVAVGHNRVLLTGDPTTHAEMEAIRNAVQVLNPRSPTVDRGHLDEGTLAPLETERGPSTPPRARMLAGLQIYCSGEPCPMCMAAIYWARLDACIFACDAEMTRRIGFDDALVYEELGKDRELRRLNISRISSTVCEQAYEMWLGTPNRRLY